MLIFNPAIIKYHLRDGVIYWLLIPGAVIGGGLAINVVLTFAKMSPSPLLFFTAALLMTAGLLFISKSTRDFTKAGGTPNPLRPPKNMVSSASYALCRHPMFFGYDLCTLSTVLLFRSYGMLLFSVPIFLICETAFLRKEEKTLLVKYNRSYPPYKEHTPFLIPSLFGKNILKR